MAKIGRNNLLEVIKFEPQGAYLQGGWLGEILLPKRYVPEDCEVGDPLNVFVYLDSKDRFIATTQTPRAQVGEVAFLEVTDVNNIGAFLDWGLPKDLLVPYNQQHMTMEVGKSYLVYIYTDEETHRIAASTKLNKYIGRLPNDYKQGQKVDLAISATTDLGYSAVIDNQYWGLLFFSDVVRPLKIGQKVKGFIKQVRNDGKVDLSLHAPGFKKIENLAERVLDRLEKSEGYLPLSDKSKPEEIYDAFSISKKAFKTAIGTLYKQRQIRIESDGIYLIKTGE
ncbi:MULTISPECIES: S1 RNA-binding domain-containing protein [unclassified Oleiphilus]|uniref:CvfB family protein n=2 Tax=Oleiphilus TaxID=141450 RepID=UPI0007C32003|nr:MULTISPECIES: S1-like domain-containing RNA-binding protein [unclassified Oleiphilus]KZY77736.1 GntR family transcriptional regulator [Oleiphilus sp. HI0068]KZY86342.1 GntR family transcriptional regulator [Oleiphilus sp. HI0069]KZY91586.1 GntR family transcriptional regulator [Oleiphilus sp. HI0072]KZZ07994.1 GntR family transcriptional regulator [Oleiphilus sp. HI0078]KZY33961.1 GntR family transcriptional regulator [Oleiphilus sp. HI0043]